MRAFCYLLLLLSCLACKEETLVLDGNAPPNANRVSAIQIDTYVNRVFIDLLGREPVDAELATEAATLRAADLSVEAREELIVRLQTGTDFIEGDTSYRYAYTQQLYNLVKTRCLEGIGDAVIRNTYLTAAATPEDYQRLVDVLDIRPQLRAGAITFDEVFARLIYNDVYDVINMNTFNFVNASFDNLLWRFPTQAEFQAGFRMVENETTETIFGGTGTNRADYVQLLTSNLEFYEGLLIWQFEYLLARRPTTQETAALLAPFFENKDLEAVQRKLMVTDEYAGF